MYKTTLYINCIVKRRFYLKVNRE